MHNVFSIFVFAIKQRYNGYTPLGIKLLVVQKQWTAAWTIGGCVRKWWVHTILKPFSVGKIHAPWT